MILINSFYDVVELLTSPPDNSLNSPSNFSESFTIGGKRAIYPEQTPVGTEPKKLLTGQLWLVLEAADYLMFTPWVYMTFCIYWARYSSLSLGVLGLITQSGFPTMID